MTRSMTRTVTFQKGLTVLIATLLTVSSPSSMAEGRARDRDPIDRAPQVDRDRTYQREHMQDRNRVPATDSARDRDRQHMQNFSQLKDQEIYGHELLSAQERDQYREQLRSAESDQQRARCPASPAIM